jgi:hypothetical protein
MTANTSSSICLAEIQVSLGSPAPDESSQNFARSLYPKQEAVTDLGVIRIRIDPTRYR